MKEQVGFISKRMIVLALLLVVFATSILYKIISIQQKEGTFLIKQASQTTVTFREVKPGKGNIYDSNGNLLVTTLPEYTIVLDPTVASDEIFNEGIDALSDSIANVLEGKSSAQIKEKIKNHRRQGKRYLPLRRKVHFHELSRYRSFPILKEGRFKGGLVLENKTTRVMPFDEVAARTLGYEKEGLLVGIEGAYANYLSGENGYRLMQKISGGEWKPVPSSEDVSPIDGADVVMHMDIRIQDMAHNVLKKQLEEYEAEAGCVILMEVETGAIKAAVNLKRTEESGYQELYNYAVGESTEPGSTFKLLSYMLPLEDGLIDTADRVETGNGKFKFYGQLIKDSRTGGFGEISVKEAFELSSNIAIAKLIEEHYGENPQEFIDRLSRLGINQKLNLEILGESAPDIKDTNDPKWSKVSLPWMAFGYELRMTPLQILTYYNAVANNGEVLKPFYVKEVRRAGRSIYQFEPEVLNNSLCSNETLRKLQDMMKGVVESGTAKNIYSERFSSAGKTGTCQLEYWKEGSREYQSSFVGYFPVENPKYSCITVVYKPNISKGFYGNVVAAPVFEELRNLLYSEQKTEMVEMDTVDYKRLPGSKGFASDLGKVSRELSLASNIELEESDFLAVESKGGVLKASKVKIDEGFLPNLIGMTARDAVYMLENIGLKVKLKGFGKVKKQSHKKGTKIVKGLEITLELG
jgi:cell division protein FtsI (penicillin-binding protein 3)